ncbi:MAG: hypothetical protein M3O50_08695 [Myxococcota bacterium]|nr:hypothetical protein [Myxococcota bacterium]
MRASPFSEAVISGPSSKGASSAVLRRVALHAALGLFAWSSSSCAPGGFQAPSTVSSVRILASTADPPYAKPGATVTLQLSAFDGRKTQTEPMVLYWLPFVCENPDSDAYYACFPKLAAGLSARGSAGATDGGMQAIGSGVDLTPLLTAAGAVGPSYRFTMPADAVTSHPLVAGAAVPYGLAILLNVACAGHLELLPAVAGNANPQALPLGCFDAGHNRLGAEDYVFGFTRVYAYEGISNANPVVDHVEADGIALGPTQTFVTNRCSADRRANCPHVRIGPVLPSSAQEQPDPSTGQPREQIWADYFSTFGQFTDDARLLFDSTTGCVDKLHRADLCGSSDTDDDFLPPAEPGNGKIWIVVRDNRGGAAVREVSVLVQ